MLAENEISASADHVGNHENGIHVGRGKFEGRLGALNVKGQNRGIGLAFDILVTEQQTSCSRMSTSDERDGSFIVVVSSCAWPVEHENNPADSWNRARFWAMTPEIRLRTV